MLCEAVALKGVEVMQEVRVVEGVAVGSRGRNCQSQHTIRSRTAVRALSPASGAARMIGREPWDFMYGREVALDSGSAIEEEVVVHMIEVAHRR